MRRIQLICLLGLLAASGWFAAEVQAAIISGTVESVLPGNRRITVTVASKQKSLTFTVSEAAVILVNNKKGTLEDIETGQSIAVTTDGKESATKLSVRSAAAKPTEKKPAPKNSTEGDDAEAPSTKVAAKSKPTGKKPPASGPNSEPPAAVAAGDWPQFRGPNRDNVSQETGLLSAWPEGGPKLAWKQTGMGLGYSSVAIAKGKIYTMGNRGDDEFLLALDAATGEHLWSLRTGAAYRNGTGDGPRGTPTVDDDRVYALGGNGDLVCAGAAKGDVIWNLNILQEFGGNNITWGICESVLIDGDHLICTPGGSKATMAALDKLTGKTVWMSVIPGQPQAAYASAIAIEVGGTRQYVNFVHTAVVGVKASDGKALWGDQKSANGTANCSTPIFANNAIFSASGYGQGGALVKLSGNGAKSTLVYHTPKMKNHHGGMSVVDGYLYGFDEDVLTCMELKSGKVQWQNRSVGKGSLTVADGHLYLRSENGPVALAEVNTKAYRETGRFNQPDRSGNASWSHPVVAGGKLYLRDMDTLLVYDVKE